MNKTTTESRIRAHYTETIKASITEVGFLPSSHGLMKKKKEKKKDEKDHHYCTTQSLVVHTFGTLRQHSCSVHNYTWRILNATLLCYFNSQSDAVASSIHSTPHRVSLSTTYIQPTCPLFLPLNNRISFLPLPSSSGRGSFRTLRK